MEQSKPTSATGRDAPVLDPALIRAALAELQLEDVEFPIRVEGTHTLPYTAHLQRIDPGTSQLFLKLIRPLPHEMLEGAPFEMSFSAGEQRFVAPMTFQGREAYLLYRFSIPQRMVQSDRRRHKRYPFRPRERAYVLAQDAGLPGHGLAGPLVNLSVGGLAFRVDRILRLDDNLCIPASTGFFDRGKELPVLKVRDIPRLPIFETRGIITYAWERNTEVILGVKFADLPEADIRQLQTAIDLREMVQRNPNASNARPDGPRAAADEDAGQPQSILSRRVNPAGVQAPDALLRLGRRSTFLLLAMAPGGQRDQIQGALSSLGYLRLQVEDSLAAALESLRQMNDSLTPLLVTPLPEDPQEVLVPIRQCQKEIGDGREFSVALLGTEKDLPPMEVPLVRAIPWPTKDPAAWLPILDDLAGL
jgi:hypothetical protein